MNLRTDDARFYKNIGLEFASHKTLNTNAGANAQVRSAQYISDLLTDLETPAG